MHEFSRQKEQQVKRPESGSSWDKLEDAQGDQSGWSTVNKVKLGQIDTAEIGGLGTLYCVRDLAVSWCESFWRILSRGKAAD